MIKALVSAFGFIILMLASVAFATIVPDTGVTKCYNDTVESACPSPGQAFYGQDAQYTINPMSYTKLDGSGNALPDSAASWVMVKDNVTGLIWEMKTVDGTIHDKNKTFTWFDSNPATNGGNAGTPGTGTDTEDFIKSLNDAHYGGYSDWRLPTIKELTSINNCSFSFPVPTIDTGYFPNTVSRLYWSSTTNVSSTDDAWGVLFGFDNGWYYVDGYKRYSNYVRAVRGGQTQSAYVDNGDGTVTDTSTGLTWQKTGSSGKTWEQALAYCESLNLGSYTDWRLPTTKELHSLTNYLRFNPAINTTYFPDTVSSFYWSSTTGADITDVAWGVYFDYGYILYANKVNSYYVRAVRGGQPGSLCNLVISPSKQAVSKDAGSTTFSVSNTGTGKMPWNAAVASGNSWLKITSGASGTDIGMINCSYPTNTTASARAETIQVTATGATGSPKDVTVTQTGTSSSILSKVPDTGQTRCYNDTAEITCTSSGQLFYGQDAQYTINPMSYTKLDVNGNPLSSSATAWSMVKDNVTGLVWEMKTNMDGLPDYSNLHDADNTYTWYDSNNSFIKALNNPPCYGGYCDWRMPTIKELAYIVNYSVPYPGPTIDTGYFPNTAESWNYWSSTTQADNTNIAWYMNFGYGRNSIDYKIKYKYVRAVREKEQPPTYADNGDGTVTDTLTGLIWQQKSSSSTYSWEQALVYCEGLNLAGYTDWRIPTIKELTSLVDYSRRAPAIDTTFFPDTKATQLYWSSTTYFNYTYGAWYVNFNTGNSIHCNKDNDNYVRAVRGQVCTSILDGNYSLFIPVLSYLDPSLGQQLCWAYFVYEYNPMYPTLLIFKWTDSGVPIDSCAALTLSEYLRIHIPDVLLPDGITHGHMDLEYSPAFSTAQDAYFIVTAPWF